jgi:type II secretory pathway pseudopilin PulG
MAIMVTLGAIAAPRYANTLANYRADAAARRLVADLNLAREKAFQSSQSRTVTFVPEDGQLSILNVQDLNTPGPTYVTKLHDKPYQAELISADFGGDSQVVFDGFGVPDSGGTAVIQAGGTQRTVVLNADTGEAEVQ